MQVDVVVNSTNKNLQLNKGAVSRLLLNKAGDHIQLECNQKYPNGIDFGTVAVTSGGNLCKQMYHFALPEWIPLANFSMKVMYNNVHVQ